MIFITTFTNTFKTQSSCLSTGLSKKLILLMAQKIIDEKRSILQPKIVIINACPLIAFLYCASSAILFYYVFENFFLAIIHLLALFSVVTNYLISIQAKKINRATNIDLATGTSVVLSLFATGGWANTAYLWQLLNNCQNHHRLWTRTEAKIFPYLLQLLPCLSA